MADKEPRRRKKNRRDSQKKDDVRSEDQFSVPQKSEARDSDQEVEEEPVIHSSHQASNLAKFVFVILFSGLVVSLSVIFISLRDVNEGPIDIFEMDHGDHHGESLHDEHIELALHDDHDEHDEHEEHEESNVSFEDILPSLGSYLSLNDEEVKDFKSQAIPEEDGEEVTSANVEDVTDYSIELEVPTDQGILEEYIEDTSASPEIFDEPVVPEIYPEMTTPVPEDESLYTTFDYPEPDELSTTAMHLDEAEATPEPFSETTAFYDDEMPVTINDLDDNDVEEDDQDTLSAYENADITNEMDFEIRDQLDEMDIAVEK